MFRVTPIEDARIKYPNVNHIFFSERFSYVLEKDIIIVCDLFWGKTR